MEVVVRQDSAKHDPASGRPAIDPETKRWMFDAAVWCVGVAMTAILASGAFAHDRIATPAADIAVCATAGPARAGDGKG
jgi:hypothetical protein